jgi:translation initiation factor 1 (eIF-1/SUI1)
MEEEIDLMTKYKKTLSTNTSISQGKLCIQGKKSEEWPMFCHFDVGYIDNIISKSEQ